MAKKRKTSIPDEQTIELAIPLPTDGIGSEKWWVGEVDKSRERIKDELPLWRANLQAYLDGKKNFESATLRRRKDIRVNLDYYNTENKKPLLFYQSPDIQLTPMQTGLDSAAPLFQAVLNQKLGADEIDAKRMVDEVLFDNLCPAGLGVTKIGYSRVTVPVQMPTGAEAPDPMTGLMAPVLGDDGQPQTIEVPKMIWEEYYWRHIPPEDLRMPATFTSSRYDESPWMGWRFKPNGAQLKADYGIDTSSIGDIPSDETLLGSYDQKYLVDMPSAVEVWYKASIYDPNEKNPEKMRRLVLLERCKGRNQTVLVHEDSPYQKFDESGALVQGMRGFPLHICALRSVTDTAYPPSDCTVSRQVADELSRGRTQMMEQRDRNLPIRGFNKKSVHKQTLQAIERGETQSLIGFEGPLSDNDFKELAKAGFPQENFVFNDVGQRDAERLWAMGANQQGVQSTTGKTATESQIIQQATDTRLAYERERVLSWYLKGVEKLSTLLQMFADHESMVSIIGEDGAQRLETWDKNKIQGRFAFTAKPDSSVRVNAAEEREVYLRYFNLVANHPNTNSIELLKSLAKKFNLDPAKVINTMPPQKDEKPKMSISIKGEDLSPLSPQFANVQILLAENGIQLPATPSPENPITSPTPIPPINQHDADLTGRNSGPRVQ